MGLEEAWHFVRADEMPSFEQSARVADVMDAVGRSGHGGFLVTRAEGPIAYVRAVPAFRRVLEDRAADRSLEDLVLTSLGSSEVVPIGRETRLGEDTSPLHDAPDTVFPLADDEGVRRGFFLNHESVRQPHSCAPVYICDKGDENQEYNDGKCSYGPHDIVDVEERC